MKRTYSGAARGKGAVYEWDGNKNIGKGRMEITETSPPSRVIFKLDFIKPFEAHNIAELVLEPKGDATKRHVGHIRSQSLPREGDEFSFATWTA